MDTSYTSHTGHCNRAILSLGVFGFRRIRIDIQHSATVAGWWRSPAGRGVPARMLRRDNRPGASTCKNKLMLRALIMPAWIIIF